jgi:hypothetical protein
MTDQQPNPRPSTFPAWAMVRLPVGRGVDTQEEIFETAVAYLVAEKRDHYLGDITRVDRDAVLFQKRRRLKHPSKIVKANVVHVFPHTTDPEEKTHIEDRIFEIATKVAQCDETTIRLAEDGTCTEEKSASLEGLRRTIQRDANGEPATILDAVTEEIIKKRERDDAVLQEWLGKSPALRLLVGVATKQEHKMSTPAQPGRSTKENGFVRVFDAADAAMIADRLADHLIGRLQRDPNMPRLTWHEWELTVADLRRDFAQQLFNLARPAHSSF